MAEKRGAVRSPGFVVDLVINRLRHTILPALDTVEEAAVKIKTDLVIANKSLIELAATCKESDPAMHKALTDAAESINESVYMSRKLRDDLDKFVADQIRGQATALSRINIERSA